MSHDGVHTLGDQFGTFDAAGDFIFGSAGQVADCQGTDGHAGQRDDGADQCKEEAIGDNVERSSDKQGEDCGGV